MKKAVIVVSFGTTYKSAEVAIENIENAVKDNFTGYDFYRAFTSTIVIKNIYKKTGIKINTISEVLDYLSSNGYTDIFIQPTHIINGLEYEKMLKMILLYKDKFKLVKLGLPLLSSNEDYNLCVKAVLEDFSLNSDEALIFMGHGTEHFANSAYCQLENTIRYLGYENIYVATVEGFPTLEYACDRLNKKGITKVSIMPFMVVAGDHAQNDLAGDEDDSWKSILTSKGYDVNILLKGLGENKKICDIFVSHLKQAKAL